MKKINNNKFVSINDVENESKIYVESTRLIVEQNRAVKQRHLMIQPSKLNYKTKAGMGQLMPGFVDSYNICGQIQPVGIVKSKKNAKYDVLFGHKRVAAAVRSGIDLIFAIEFISENEDFIEMVKIDESFIKEELSTLKRADLLKKRKKLWESLKGLNAENDLPEDDPKFKKEKENEIISFDKRFIPFSEDMATRTNQSPRTIQQEIQIAEGIHDANKKMILGTFLENKKVLLLELSRIKDAELQAAVINDILEHRAKNVRDALMQRQDSFVMRPSPTGENSSEQLRINLRQQKYVIKTLMTEKKELEAENSRLKEEKLRLEETLAKLKVPCLISMDESEYSFYSQELSHASK